MQRVLCIMTSVRGGSKLLHYLLDSHKQILSFPRTFQFDIFWNEVNQYNSLDEIVNKFMDYYPRFFDGNVWKNYNILDKADQLGKNRDETFKINKILFKKEFIEFFKEKEIFDSRSVFINLHKAYQRALGREIKNNSIILYHIHALANSKSLQFCIKDFGINNIKVIFMTKHPLEGLRSIVNWMDNVSISIHHQPITLLNYQIEILNGFDLIKRINPRMDYKIFLLDHLKQNKHKFIHDVVRFLKIDFNDDLLKPTINGKLWGGNSKDFKNGIDSRYIEFEPKNILEKKDWFFMKVVFSKRMKEYNLLDHNYKVSRFNKLLLFLILPLPSSYEVKILNKYFNKININSFNFKLKEIFIFIIFLRNFIYAYIAGIIYKNFYFFKSNSS